MITPVLLCGGSGTRLWPLSRKSYPKQFVPLIGEDTLFQASAQRLSGAGFNAPLVITHSDFRFIVAEQLAGIGIDPSAILIEPQARNTAPAVLAAALYLQRTSPDALMLVAPSDHLIPDGKAFRAAVEAGREAALAGRLVTFGVRPTRAETGFGYIEQGPVAADFGERVHDIARFVEKPDATAAARMVAHSRFLWNTGIFLMSVTAVIAAFCDHALDLIAPVAAAVKTARTDIDFVRLDPAAWSGVADISIDFAIMERAANLAVVPFDGSWSDLGCWDAVWRETKQDVRGVAVFGSATAIDCEATLLRSEDPSVQLVGLGLKNMIVVAMPDAVLVADASHAQEVGKVVAALKAQGAKQATQFPKDHRPWGWFESLVVGARFQVKRIVVHPGAALSLQSHHHRSEHWTVVEGTARVTVDEKVTLVTENQSVYIPLGAVHRMENPGKLPMVLIEVQTGCYLGEDDIIRYEDVYSRS
ncbi:MAG: mannose-1-phosphate guanylyltransferase/mannose-6-phosphate isomerase [Cypionkella sp.]